MPVSGARIIRACAEHQWQFTVRNDHSTRESTTRVGPMVNVRSLLIDLRCDPDPLFQQAGFEPEEFSDPDHRVAFRKASRLLEFCAEATGTDQFGFLLGKLAEPSHLGLPGFLVRTAPTVRSALEALIENLDLHDQGASASLDIGPEYTSLSYTVLETDVAAIDQIADLAVVNIYKIMRVLCGEDWVATAVKLARCEPEDTSSYTRYFRTPLFFNSAESAVTFPNNLLSNSVPGGDVLLFEHLEKEARVLHDILHREPVDLLPAALRRGLLTGRFSSHEIADELGIHERTLQRRLRAADTSFRQELDLARKTFGEQLLSGTTLPIGDIANTLGYADSSGFIRAFERWCGVSPSNWRKANGGAAVKV